MNFLFILVLDCVCNWLVLFFYWKAMGFLWICDLKLFVCVCVVEGWVAKNEFGFGFVQGEDKGESGEDKA